MVIQRFCRRRRESICSTSACEKANDFFCHNCALCFYVSSQRQLILKGKLIWLMKEMCLQLHGYTKQTHLTTDQTPIVSALPLPPFLPRIVNPPTPLTSSILIEFLCLFHILLPSCHHFKYQQAKWRKHCHFHENVWSWRTIGGNFTFSDMITISSGGMFNVLYV